MNISQQPPAVHTAFNPVVVKLTNSSNNTETLTINVDSNILMQRYVLNNSVLFEISSILKSLFSAGTTIALLDGQVEVHGLQQVQYTLNANNQNLISEKNTIMTGTSPDSLKTIGASWTYSKNDITITAFFADDGEIYLTITDVAPYICSDNKVKISVDVNNLTSNTHITGNTVEFDPYTAGASLMTGSDLKTFSPSWTISKGGVVPSMAFSAIDYAADGTSAAASKDKLVLSIYDESPYIKNSVHSAIISSKKLSKDYSGIESSILTTLPYSYGEQTINGILEGYVEFNNFLGSLVQVSSSSITAANACYLSIGGFYGDENDPLETIISINIKATNPIFGSGYITVLGTTIVIDSSMVEVNEEGTVMNIGIPISKQTKLMYEGEHTFLKYHINGSFPSFQYVGVVVNTSVPISATGSMPTEISETLGFNQYSDDYFLVTTGGALSLLKAGSVHIIGSYVIVLTFNGLSGSITPSTGTFYFSEEIEITTSMWSIVNNVATITIPIDVTTTSIGNVSYILHQSSTNTGGTLTAASANFSFTLTEPSTEYEDGVNFKLNYIDFNGINANGEVYTSQILNKTSIQEDSLYKFSLDFEGMFPLGGGIFGFNIYEVDSTQTLTLIAQTKFYYVFDGQFYNVSTRIYNGRPFYAIAPTTNYTLRASSDGGNSIQNYGTSLWQNIQFTVSQYNAYTATQIATTTATYCYDPAFVATRTYTGAPFYTITNNFLAVNAVAQLAETSDLTSRRGTYLTRIDRLLLYPGYPRMVSCLGFSGGTYLNLAGQVLNAGSSSPLQAPLFNILLQAGNDYVAISNQYPMHYLQTNAGTIVTTNYRGEIITISDPANGYLETRLAIETRCIPANPFYLRWLNRLGGYDYWMFSFRQTIKEKVKITDTYYPVVYDQLTATAFSHTIGLDGTATITVGADGLSDNEYDTVSKIIYSPYIQYYDTEKARWISLTISDSDVEKDTYASTQEVEITFALPTPQVQF